MSTIENNVTAKNFRLRAEDKNTLSQKGSMYVGTGNKSSEDPTVCETVAIQPVNFSPDGRYVLTNNPNPDEQGGGLMWHDIVDAINEDSLSNIAYAESAMTAEYAKGGENKGTIEERLTNLGFKEGVVENLAATASTNFIKRQGNYVFGELTFADDTAIVNKNLYGVIPEIFRPKQEQGITVYGSFVRMEKVNSDIPTEANEELYGCLKIYINPSSGSIISTGIKADRYLYNRQNQKWSQTKNYTSLDWYTYSIYGLKIYFGYEAKPISTKNS